MSSTLTTNQIIVGEERAFAIVPNLPGLSTMTTMTLIANIHATSAVNPPQLNSLDSQEIGAMLLQLYHDERFGSGTVTLADMTGFTNYLISANNSHPFNVAGTDAQLFAAINQSTTAPFLGRLSDARIAPFAAEALKIFADSNNIA
jgi:hypothetical protein